MRMGTLFFTGIFCLALTTHAGTISGAVTAKGLRKPADILVFIEKVQENNFKPSAKHAVMDQKELVFKPFILPIVVGSTVDFHNSDTVLHNVFTPDAVADKFNLGTWPKGQVKSYTFKKPGTAVVLCNVHPEMEAYVVALRNPYATTTNDAGKFSIPERGKDGKPTVAELPAGTYKIWTWHPKLGSVTQEVTVPAKGNVEMTLAVSRGKPQPIDKLYKP